MNSHEALLEVQSIGMEYPSWTFTLNMKKKNIYKSTKKYQKIPKQQTYVKICGCLGPTWAKAEAGPGALGFPRLEIVVIAQVLSHVAHVTGIAGFNKMADESGVQWILRYIFRIFLTAIRIQWHTLKQLNFSLMHSTSIETIFQSRVSNLPHHSVQYQATSTSSTSPFTCHSARSPWPCTSPASAEVITSSYCKIKVRVLQLSKNVAFDKTSQILTFVVSWGQAVPSCINNLSPEVALPLCPPNM